MNDQQRVELDAWFAEADDVLDNWRGSGDAMYATASREPSADPLPRVDSYYDEPRHAARMLSSTWQMSHLPVVFVVIHFLSKVW